MARFFLPFFVPIIVHYALRIVHLFSSSKPKKVLAFCKKYTIFVIHI